MNKIYGYVTERIIKSIEDGVVPWEKPFTGFAPMNMVSKHPYSGINKILLWLNDYPKPFYMTYKQIDNLGGKIKKGEKYHMVVFWNMIEIDNEDDKSKIKKKSVLFLRYYRVYNVDQCIDIPENKIPVLHRIDVNPIEQADNIVKSMPNCPVISHVCMDKAVYNVIDDIVTIPEPSLFVSVDSYYATLFHELVHGTGHKSRLNRDNGEIAYFGSKNYAKEELIAQLGSAFLCSECNIDNVGSSSSYIDSWIKHLQDDVKLIITAASKAQKAVDYILNRSNNYDNNRRN